MQHLTMINKLTIKNSVYSLFLMNFSITRISLPVGNPCEVCWNHLSFITVNFMYEEMINMFCLMHLKCPIDPQENYHPHRMSVLILAYKRINLNFSHFENIQVYLLSHVLALKPSM